jgi:acetyl-CoA C-acetyltransferase
MEVVIASAVRTAIGKFQGSLAGISAPRLGAIAIREAIRRAGIAPEQVDEVIMGCVLAAGLGQNPARQALIHAGVPDTVGAYTINKVCGSGLKAVALAAQAIKAGDAHVVVAGGQENMSAAPYLLPKARDGYRLGHGQVIDSMVFDGLTDIYKDIHMGLTAEMVAEKYGIAREAQDAFAAESQRRACAAQEAGHFKAEIVPVELPQKKGPPVVFDTDEGPRKDTTAEALARLRPAFKADGGTVTAGNASTINDGAAALVVMSATKAKELGVTPLARVMGYATNHHAPEWVMTAPIGAVQGLLARLGRTAADFDMFELNEAFCVQAIACTRDLGLDPAKVNVQGGATALGHPIGASGARILTTLLHGLKRTGGKRGIAALCLGGGGAVALAVEML